MRSLYVRRLLLWPRFHQSVSGALEAAEPRVEQLLVGLSARGQALQKALLQAVDACLQELRGCTSDVDVSQLTVENALFKSFDTVVRLQLEPVWHRIPRRAKALCSDLHHLRKLLNSLVRYDAVTFFEYLESVFDATSAQPPAERSHWVLQHSEPVYVLARDRVYELVREQGRSPRRSRRAPPPPPRPPPPPPRPPRPMTRRESASASWRRRHLRRRRARRRRACCCTCAPAAAERALRPRGVPEVGGPPHPAARD